MRRIVKKKKFNFKLLFIIVGIIIVIASIIGIIFMSLNHKETNLVYDNFDAITTKIDNNTYYIFGAKKDISFVVEKNKDFSYELVDNEGNKIECIEEDSDKEITIKAPKDLYKDGNIYTIKIDNGTFKNEELKDSKVVTFNIKRAASQTSVLKENVKTVNKSDITVEKDILKTSEKYKKDDIILIMDNEDVLEGYKITDGNSVDGYKYVLPELNEIYEEFDYYGMEKIDLSQLKTDETSSKMLLAMIKSSVLNSLVDMVYADASVKVTGPSWNKKTNQLEYVVKINTNEKDKVFDKEFLVYHKANITFEVTVSADLYRDISFDNYDVALIVNMNIKPKTEFISGDTDFSELHNAFNIQDDKYDIDKIKKDDTSNSDKIDYNYNLSDVKIKTNIPGLYVKFNSNIMISVDGKADIAANMDEKIKYIAGINNDMGIYGSYDYNSEGKMTTFGNMNSKIGNTTNMEVLFMNTNSLVTSVTSGLDITNKIEYTDVEDKDKNKGIKVLSNGISKVYNTYNIVSNISGEELTKKIIDDSKEISKNKKEFEFYKILEEEKEEENLEEKVTTDIIKNKLKSGFDTLNKNGTLSVFMDTATVKYKSSMAINTDTNILSRTYDYDNGKASYTCNYNYLKETMECSNYTETVDYIKGVCDKFYEDYQACQNTEKCENEAAEEWDFLYGTLDKCYYEVIDKAEPANYKEEFEKILEEAKLTKEDLNMLEQ